MDQLATASERRDVTCLQAAEAGRRSASASTWSTCCSLLSSTLFNGMQYNELHEGTSAELRASAQTVEADAKAPKRWILNAFEMASPTHHNPGLWKHPDDRSGSDYNSIEYWTGLAQLCERGKFNGIFSESPSARDSIPA